MVVTSGLHALGLGTVCPVLLEVGAFVEVTEDDDPFGEHDCALLTVGELADSVEDLRPHPIALTASLRRLSPCQSAYERIRSQPPVEVFEVGMRARDGLLALICLFLAGCVTAETTSTVSAGDIPASKYRKVAVFVENIDDSEHLAAEQAFVAALRDAGITAEGSLEIFRTQFSDDQKAQIIRDQKFDATLYVTIVQKALVEEPVPDVSYDGRMFHGRYGPIDWSSSGSMSYVVNAAGTVVRPMLTLMTKSELQDVWSAKQVWAAQTSVSVNAKYGTMNSVVGRAAAQVVEKLQEDHAI